MNGELIMAYFLRSRIIHNVQDQISNTKVNQLWYVMLHALWKEERDEKMATDEFRNNTDADFQLQFIYTSLLSADFNFHHNLTHINHQIK